MINVGRSYFDNLVNIMLKFFIFLYIKKATDAYSSVNRILLKCVGFE